MNPEPRQLKVPASDLDYDGDLFYTYAGEAFTGIAVEEVPGKWVSEVSYNHGLQEGVARDWYPSGTLKSESWYRENTLHGFSRDYNEDQVKVLEEIHEYGILTRRTRWNDAGGGAETWAIDQNGPRLRSASAIPGTEAVARNYLTDPPGQHLAEREFTPTTRQRPHPRTRTVRPCTDRKVGS